MKRLIALFTALALGVLFTSTMFRAQPAYAQGGNEDCPAGTIQVAKFNWNDEQGAFVLEGPNPGNVVISNVSLDDDDEPTGADWTSDVPISVIIVKAGPGASQDAVNPPATSGSFSTDAPPAISNVKFCSPVDEPDPGFIKVIKEVTSGNEQFDQNILSLLDIPDWEFQIDDDPFFTLDGQGGMTGPIEVDLGSHTVTELSAPRDGFVTSVSCDDEDPTVGNSAKVEVGEGETIECTFTNTLQLGSIKLIKVVEGGVSDHLDDWAFKGTGPFGLKVEDFIPLIDKAGGSQGPVPVPVGDYEIIEETQPMYIPSVECTVNGQSIGTPGNEGDRISFSLDAGQNVICTFTNTKEKTTAISLVSFEVEANDGRAMIIWETATEIDNAGFNLYRAASPTGPWAQINSALIGAEGDTVSGAHYSFADTPGRGIFYYRLEDVDFFGKTIQHDPVVAQLGPAIRLPWFRPTLPSLD